uniref:Homing endonuclease n=1 Tax=viral metagenome TaxID=1070528 RepID=A0A6M3LUS2_9ZZZZ
MNWDYVAGLYDGDGHGNLFLKPPNDKIKQRRFSAVPLIELAVSGDVIIPLRTFFNELGVFPQKRKYGYTTKTSNPWGSAKYIKAGSWKGTKIICENLIPRCYIKKDQLNLLFNAIKLREYIIKNKRHNEDFISYFDYYRHEIHKYAKKGPKKIREYDYPIIEKFNLERLLEWE